MTQQQHELPFLHSEYTYPRNVLVRALKERLSQGTLQFGPIYQVQTRSDGPIQQITTVYATSQANPDNRTIYLLALGDNGDIIGHREMTISQSEDSSHAVATGTIHTGVRGQGLASYIETATLFTLQLESNRLQQPLSFEVSNANADDLAMLWSEEEDPAAMVKIEEKEKEQQRWQAIWGGRGWAGIRRNPTTQTLERVFHPETGGDTLDNLATVSIVRDEPTSEGIRNPHVLARQSFETIDRALFSQRQRLKIAQILSRLTS